MPPAPELPPVALVHSLRVSVFASTWRAGWELAYGRPSRCPVLVLFGLN